LNLSRTKAKRGGIPIQCTERDVAILRAVNRYRYMRTGQIHRLLFSENKSIQSARKRLKLLFHNKYLGRIHPYLQKGNQEQNGDIAYYLGSKGSLALEDLGEHVFRYNKANQVKHHFLSHALDLSEFRLHLERAIDQTEGIHLARFIADFELKEGTVKEAGKKRYRLYDEILHPISREKITVYPDAALILEAVGSNEKRLLFLEIDRGTEGLEIIRKKLVGYHLYAKNRVFMKYGSFDRFSVLFQTNSPKRAQNMIELVGSMICEPDILVTDYKQVNTETLLQKQIWFDKSGSQRSLIRP
jgi:hypothetical protein